MLQLTLAAAYRSEKKWAEAERELEAALVLDPQSSEALSSMTDLLVFRNERGRAIARVQQTLATYPNDVSAHLILGSILSGGNAYKEARLELERAIELDPNLTAAYLRLAKIDQDQGNIDSALAGYEKALALQPNLPPLLTILGNLYLEDKADLRNARRYYEKAVAIDANFAPAVANLAYVEAEQGGDLNVALGLAQKAKQMLPDADPISDILAWIEYRKGSYRETIPMFKECVRKDPERAVYRYHLGMALLAAGDKGEAKSQLESALQLKLGADNAQHARAKLAQIQAN
jgi:tetratricopeptide (TPR) repeat protein